MARQGPTRQRRLRGGTASRRRCPPPADDRRPLRRDHQGRPAARTTGDPRPGLQGPRRTHRGRGGSRAVRPRTGPDLPAGRQHPLGPASHVDHRSRRRIRRTRQHHLAHWRHGCRQLRSRDRSDQTRPRTRRAGVIELDGSGIVRSHTVNRE
ncbi:hypothetical protein C3E77_07350 [Mycetocola zhujimingii]|nr:hypothetical protein C3E77_07350 [Mycetocola zhujimingii]